MNRFSAVSRILTSSGLLALSLALALAASPSLARDSASDAVSDPASDRVSDRVSDEASDTRKAGGKAQTEQAEVAAEAKSEAEFLQTGDVTPWIYEGSDVPRDPEWLFGQMDNDLRYAVRNNGVPPGQISIRIRIDAGSLHERDEERGFAHLMEHLSFRESQYLAQGEAIPTWQRLGATFGSDTNAETSATHTVYKLDLPDATVESVEESFKLLSGMMRAPVLNEGNLAAEVPIVLAEKRERGGPGLRVAEETRRTLFAGQRLANRLPIGTEETLTGATAEMLREFHRRWYRPENTVISVAGDRPAEEFAVLIEKYFGDWKAAGAHQEAPDFGDPIPPAGADSARPVGEVKVQVEPDLPRAFTYGYMRKWRPVNDTIVYNQGLLRDALAMALINRRLEARARSGGSFLYAQIQQDDVSRSTDGTFISFAPLNDDWQGALADIRGVIADALDTPPSQEEIDRETAEFDSIFASQVEQRAVMAGGDLADDIVQAVDIRETVAAPETVLIVFRQMKDEITPEAIFDHTQKLFKGEVIRGFYVTPVAGEATADTMRAALQNTAKPAQNVRIDASAISFADLPPIGEPGAVTSRVPLGVLGIEQVTFDNGARALLWANKAEAGRVAVKLRFGSGYRAFAPKDAPYISLGESALIGSGLGDLGQEELDRISTGRVMGFDFGIDDASFTFSAQTRGDDLEDQLYLLAGKLAMPRWDANPVLRAIAAEKLAYESYATTPSGVLNRDLEYLLRDGDARFQTTQPDQLNSVTPEGFRELWEPLLAQGEVELMVFGDFDADETIEALRKTIGALPAREPIPADAAARTVAFPTGSLTPQTIPHRGDANQAAAIVAWPSGGGVSGLPESRQLNILTDIFNIRLIDAMREKAGASYAPNVGSSWPVDLKGGGRITALAQLRPQDVPVFFTVAQDIAADLAATPPTQDELSRVTEPLNQLIRRASTGNGFWMYQLQGATRDPRRIDALRTLLPDYTVTTPARMQALAQKYLEPSKMKLIAIIPEGQELATAEK